MMACVVAAVVSAYAAHEAVRANNMASITSTMGEIDQDILDWLCDWDLAVPRETGGQESI